MIHQLNIHGQDKVEIAIDRLKSFEPEEGYYLCFSGGRLKNRHDRQYDMSELMAEYEMEGK